MNTIKTYKISNKKKGQVSFGSRHGGMWIFRIADRESGAYEKLMKVPGGLKIAEKIAETIHKSWLRTAGRNVNSSSRIDGTARRKIDLLVRLRTLKDWKDEPEWWSNEVPTEPAVPMVPAVEGFSEKDLAAEEQVIELEALVS